MSSAFLCGMASIYGNVGEDIKHRLRARCQVMYSSVELAASVNRGVLYLDCIYQGVKDVADYVADGYGILY